MKDNIQTKNLSAGVCTLGCRVNQYESDCIMSEFVRLGFEIKDFSEVCDVYVINSCTVTATGDKKSKQMVRRAKKQNQNAIVAVCGCLSQRRPEIFADELQADIVLGTGEKTKIPELALKLLQSLRSGPEIDQMVSISPFGEYENIETGARLSTNTRAYIKIQDGCDCRCSYCVIPQVRGPARSRSYEQIAIEAGRLCELGCLEIVLTGIEISSYGKDLGTKGSGLIELLEKLGSEPKLNRLKSIRLSSLDPSLLKKDFVDALAQLELLAPHFHLSLQSGSTAMLNKMRRKYTAEAVAENLAYARQKIGELNLTSDIIVGFPGETEEDFNKTLEMVKYLDIYHAHIFKYSKRPGTEAASFGDQVDERSKNSRSQTISSACGQIKERIHKNNIGKTFEAILEEQDKDGFYAAKTKNFMDLKITPKNNAALVGSIQTIQSVDCDKNFIYGKIREEQNGI